LVKSTWERHLGTHRLWRAVSASYLIVSTRRLTAETARQRRCVPRLRPPQFLVRYCFLRAQFALLVAVADVHFAFDVNRFGRGINCDSAQFAPADLMKADLVRVAVLAAQRIAQQI